MNALGKHLLLELKGCDFHALNDLAFLRETLLQAAREVRATIVGDAFHHFQPYGVTGIVAIAESHLCIHTWPEYEYAAVDVFTCGESFEPETAAQFIIEKLKPRDISAIELKRGVFSASPASLLKEEPKPESLPSLPRKA